MRRLIVPLVLAAMALTACDVQPSANDQEHAQQAATDRQQQINQPLPSFAYSQWKQNLTEIETAEANGVQTTSFMMGSQNDPDPIQVCPSVGVPIPVTASLSNPHQIVWSRQGGAGVVGQKDPNGIYMPPNGAGTFVVCIGADGAASPVYVEGLVHTVFGPAVWDYSAHQIKITGPSSFHFTKGQGR